MRRITPPLLLLCLLAQLHSEIVTIEAEITSIPPPQQPKPVKAPIYLTVASGIGIDRSTPDILRSMAVPGYARPHGFTHVALPSWSCPGSVDDALKAWTDPVAFLPTLGSNGESSRRAIKQAYSLAGIQVLANVQVPTQQQISDGLDASNCSQSLADFLIENELDGINLVVQSEEESDQSELIQWLAEFTLGLSELGQEQMTVVHSVGSSFFDREALPSGNYFNLHGAVGEHIDYYSLRAEETSYKGLFTHGQLSVKALSEAGLPLHKIIIEKTTDWEEEGYVSPLTLLEYFKQAQYETKWQTGVALSPFVPHPAQDRTAALTLRRDPTDVISAVSLDKINHWWPPEKTIADIGVPGYAPDNMYNHFVFGTWSCSFGALDIAKLWSQASFYMGDRFGATDQQIQQYLKSKYQSRGKKILVRAFGLSESPTTSQLSASVCARGLARFVLTSGFDGVEINYRDNEAFNAGTAQEWLVEFSRVLRRQLPFHTISHAIQGFYLSEGRYSGGGYTKVIQQAGKQADFYQIVYYGEQVTQFDSYQQIFRDSGDELKQIAVVQLVGRGFELDKIVVAKPVRLSDASGAGFVEPIFIRRMFLEAHEKLGWKGGIGYSSYTPDQSGHALSLLLRGMDNSESIRFTYSNTVNKWWPPQDTLAQMGVPELAPENPYNYFAYSFWLCGSGPEAISKVYSDPVTFLGTQLGENKQQIQDYIYSRYQRNSVKLMVSAFGATEYPWQQGFSASECGDKFVQFIRENKLEGVDIDYEDSESFRNGTGEQWVSTFTRIVRQAHPFLIISHAPQAPYFSPPFGPRGGYHAVNELVGQHIDFYNVQFYNQMNETYQDYDTLFLESTALNPETSVFEIIRAGVEGSKVVLGKPVTPEDAYNTGWVDSQELGEMIVRAREDPLNPGWKPHVMYWQYLSDLEGESISQALPVEAQ